MCLMVVALIMVGCSISVKPKNVESSIEAKSGKAVYVDFEYFKKDNHDWIMFAGNSVWQGVMHDPNCKCK